MEREGTYYRVLVATMLDSIEINRAPVLTLWIAVVAERMGHTWETALTVGKVFAGLNAQAKGRLIGIYSQPSAPPNKHKLGEEAGFMSVARAQAQRWLGGLAAALRALPQRHKIKIKTAHLVINSSRAEHHHLRRSVLLCYRSRP